VSRSKPKALQALLGQPSDAKDPDKAIEHLIRLFGVIGSPGYPTEQSDLRQRIGRGDKVAITPLGRQPVVDGSGKKRKRNEYRVEVLERANPAQARP